MRRILTFWASLLLFMHSGACQDKNILECLKLIDFEPHNYVEADINLGRADTVIDLGTGYYELSLSSEIENIKLCQATKFNNADGTITLAITGYIADMQCNNHPSYFYEISKSGDSFIRIENTTIIPSLDLLEFLTGSKSIEVLKKYLPEIKETYLNSNATIEDVLNEIYDFHLIVPRKGAKIKVTLTLCDYIPLNEVEIHENDWNVIKDNIKIVELLYDRELKQFKNISNTK
jgi:hypothetical protein